MVFLSPQVEQLIHLSLTEDLGEGDVTTLATIPAHYPVQGKVQAKERLVLAGLEIFTTVFHLLDPQVEVQLHTTDRQWVEPGAIVAAVHGEARVLLQGERVALNFLQRLSGVATLTAHYVERVKGYKAQIIDTRKTTPGWRSLEKYAVRVGGGKNHRTNLSDGILIKDNHITAAGGITAAVQRARAYAHHLLKVEIEVQTLEQVHEALEANAEVILLDNMSLDLLKEAVDYIGGRAITEASGGVRLDTVKAIAQTGVDYISVGKLTHSAPAVDLNMKLV
jgi:nicotinate-nucleotide pyrophosphorylase (carboxylating)